MGKITASEVAINTQVAPDAYGNMVSGSLYASTPMLKFYEAVTGGAARRLVAKSEDGTIQGSISWVEKTTADGCKAINSHPWFGSYGGCFVMPGAHDQTRDILLQQYAENLEGSDTAAHTLIISPWEQPHIDIYRRYIRSDVEDSRIAQISALPELNAPSDEQLMSLLESGRRTQVRKSLRQGFHEIVDDSENAWDFLHAVHAENMSAIGGRPKPKSHFDAMRSLLPKEWVRLSTAYHGAEPVAALLIVRHGPTVEYITPVIRHEWRPRQPMTYLIWLALKWACATGAKEWNWGGTWAQQASLHRFKRGWGAKDRPYTYLVSASDSIRCQLETDPASLLQQLPYFFIFPFDKLKS